MKYIVAGARKGSKESKNYNINVYTYDDEKFLKDFAWIDSQIKTWDKSGKSLKCEGILKEVNSKGVIFFENDQFIYVMKTI